MGIFIPLTIEQIKKLNTRRLLAYYKKYRFRSIDLCSSISFRQDSEFFEGYLQLIKKELDAREHIK